MNIVYVASLEGHLIVPLSAVENLRRQQIDFSFKAFHQAQLKDGNKVEQFEQALKQADILIVRLLGALDDHPQFKKYIDLYHKTDRLKIVLYSSNEEQEILEQWTTISKDIATKLRNCIRYGSVDHFESLIKILQNQFDDGSYEIQELVAPEPVGFYDPEQGVISSERALASLSDETWKALILFHQSHYLNGNVEYIQHVFEEVKTQGGAPISLFLRGDSDEHGISHIETIIESTLIHEGKPVIDIVLNVMVAPAMLETANVIANGNRVKTAFEKLNVPIIQGMAAYTTKDNWEESINGVSQSDVTYHAVLPEFLGHIITHPIAFKQSIYEDADCGIALIRHVIQKERLIKYVTLSKKWAMLRLLKNEQKKVAILFHNYPPRNDTIGTAQGLDSPESVVNMLREMKKLGYTIDNVPDSGQKLMEKLLTVATNDHRYTSYEALAQRAQGIVSKEKTSCYFRSLAKSTQQKVIDQWGEAPGELLVSEQGIIIPGFYNGNIFIGIQPTRGYEEDPSAVLHSTDLVIPHSYYTYYRWLVEEFKADAVVHVGTHGSLEWLPGKSLGLGDECFPDIAIQTLPNIYPYVINNPGEGIQAKRRSYACLIGHLSPVLQQSGLYGELSVLDELIDEYEESKHQPSVKTEQIKKSILTLVEQLELYKDVNVEKKALVQLELQAFEDLVRKLHSLLSEWKHAQIKNGMHIFGQAPNGQKLIDQVASLTRLKNNDTPSLHNAISHYLGFEYTDLLNAGQEKVAPNISASALVDEIQEVIISMLEGWSEFDFSESQVKAIQNDLSQQVQQIIGKYDLNLVGFERKNNDLEKILLFISQTLVPNIRKTPDEMHYFLSALSGGFVPAGPSGAPSRGMAHLIPTGRNFYGLDPRAIPAKNAWQVGMQLAEDLLAHHVATEKEYPESVGIVLWGSPMIRTKGDDIAEVLYLLGVRPIWQEGGNQVQGLEVISIEELGRPRIDVTMRISGFLRDGFPHIVDLLDEAVRMVAFLDEPDDQNFVAKHVREEMNELRVQGMDEKEVKDQSAIRIFGCKPGAYGAGVNQVIEGKQWTTRDDLAEAYENWSSFAYGKNRKGEQNRTAFKRAFGQIQVAVKNMDSNEHDIMGSTDYYAYHGGMIAASEVISGEAPIGMIGDSANPESVKSRTVLEENRRLFRTRILNPKWIESMKEHGYKGAGDISKTFDRTLGWHAVSHSIDTWMFEQLAETFVLNEDYQQWVQEVNPYALMNMTETLLEAQARGMWNPSQEMLEQLQEMYLSMESEMEELGDEQ